MRSNRPRERVRHPFPGSRVRAALLGFVPSVLIAPALAGPPAASAAAALALAPCQIEHPLRLTVAAADCGILEVPENPQDPGGRRIGLYVARVAAISRRKQADPLFVLAGGPGTGGERLLRKRRGGVRAHPARARHRARRPARYRRLQSPRLRRGRGAPVPRLRRADRRRHARCLDVLRARADAPTTPPSSRCAILSACARARLRAHQPLRCLLRHARGAAVPAPLSRLACARSSSTAWCRPSRRGSGGRRSMPSRRCAASCALRGRAGLQRALRRTRGAITSACARILRGTPCRCGLRIPRAARRSSWISPRPARERAAPRRLQRRLRRAPAAACCTRPPAGTLRRSAAQFLLARALLRGHRGRHAQQRGVRRGRALLRHAARSIAPASPRPSWAPRSLMHSSLICRIWPHGPVDAGPARATAQRGGGALALGQR